MPNSCPVVSCFISDLHLSAQHPKTTDFFLSWLSDPHKSTQQQFQSLYILGDLFEFWLGDDGVDLLEARPTFEALQRLTQQGISVYFCRGNRDFLLSESLLNSYGIGLIHEGTRITPNTLVLHGDSLCLDDEPYARWYAQCRDLTWQQQFLNRPLDERLAMAQAHRQHSEQQDFYLRDVDPTALESLLKQQPSSIDLVVHGHTHWANVHNQSWGKRVVLPDWDLDDTQHPRYGWAIVSEGTSYLQINDQRIEF
jgi:UDP-2,3-diacylglucosamine hydrolase